MEENLSDNRLVSIVVPAYNAAATLEPCLQACLNQTYRPVEIIVVDDGSTDDTPRIAQALPVHYLRQENRGPAAARNAGAAKGSGAFVAFTDSDCIPEPDWIERLVAECGEGVAGVGGTYCIANPESKLARMIHAEIASRHERCGSEVDFLGSFNVIYRRDAFESVGGFDEAFSRASAEDNDLSYRMVDAGGKLRFTRLAIVRHFHPTQLWPYLRTQARHGFWRVKLYCKHRKRAFTGDRYAGRLELIVPALVLFAAVLAVCAGLAWGLGMFVAVAALLGFGYVGVRSALSTLAFGYVLALRDLARGAGMCLGIARFVILGRGACR